MYANLKVKVERGRRTDEHSAWKVEVIGPEAFIHTDLNEGGQHAEEGPVLRVDTREQTITISADF